MIVCNEKQSGLVEKLELAGIIFCVQGQEAV